MLACSLPVLILMIGAAILGGFVTYAYLKSILSALRNKLRNERKQISTLESDFKKADLNRHELKVEKEKLLNYTRDQNIKIQHLNVQLQDLLYDHEQKINEFDELRKGISEVASSGVSTNIVGLQKDFDELDEKYQFLKKSVNEKNALIIRLKNEKDAFVSELNKHKEIIHESGDQRASENYRKLKLDYDALKNKYENLFKDLTEYKSRYQNYVKEYHEMRVKANNLEKVKVQMEQLQKGNNLTTSEILRLREENRNLKKALEEQKRMPRQSSDFSRKVDTRNPIISLPTKNPSFSEVLNETEVDKNLDEGSSYEEVSSVASEAQVVPTLQNIKGIDDEMAAILVEYGFSSLKHISELSSHDITILQVALELENDQIVNEKWIDQAKKLLKV